MTALPLAFALLAAPACYSTKMVFAEAPPAQVNIHRAWNHTFVYGFFTLGRVDLDRFCGRSEVHSIRTQVGLLGLLAGAVTAGIWTPMTVEVTCARRSGDAGSEGSEDVAWNPP